jgi:hypothetical protein
MIKSRIMRCPLYVACMGEKWRCTFCRTTRRKQTPRKNRLRWEDNIQMALKETGDCEPDSTAQRWRDQ